MSQIKVPPWVRKKLVARIEAVIEAVADDYDEPLGSELSKAPYPALSERERAAWLLRREAQKALQQARLRQDGARVKLKAAAVGQHCPQSGQVMQSADEVELEHEEYDGRPPVAVHKDWHKKAQPH